MLKSLIFYEGLLIYSQLPALCIFGLSAYFFFKATRKQGWVDLAQHLISALERLRGRELEEESKARIHRVALFALGGLAGLSLASLVLPLLGLGLMLLGVLPFDGP